MTTTTAVMTTTTNTTTSNIDAPPPAILCRPTKKKTTSTSTVKPSTIPPAFVLDSNGRKLFRSSCRARGVGAKDHTPENAYLLVPEDVRHGHLLRCSHPWCLKSGRLFRYCVVCRQPVTKRNFHKRHGHGLIRYHRGRSILPADDDELLEDAADVVPSSAPPPVSLPALVIGGDRTTPLDGATTTLVGTEEAAGVASATGNVVSDEDSSAAACPQPAVSSSGGITTTVSPDEMAWLQLFRERPPTSTQQDAMNKWYSSIVSTCYPGEQKQPFSAPPTPVVPPPPTTEEKGESIEPFPLMHDEEHHNEDYSGLETFDMVFDLEEEGGQQGATELDNADLDFLIDRNYEIV
eukprot:CAMPEP_0194045940 /NCGR_PEP_ID=MMETSP0009_2-20130614/19013_1 /TAXON_ID=210454 /ORGANISM="Grammatophora oceanica, Strain CCMP 410" /LENGTH=348 /DNA_ID=CAMNT_0038690991 /DNA_START=288 /DNA_END=1334 /DNA_ORIENTATION=+